ncbi:MAG: beta-lactamase family protein [Spirochaetes bacterium]|nr:beta-lactamase family protein [Spirochaetota bacterium]
MMKRTKAIIVSGAAAAGFFLLSCTSPTSPPLSPPVSTNTGPAVEQREADLRAALDAVVVADGVDFSFIVKRTDGRTFRYERGTSTLNTLYQSASTSKLVSAVIILRQLDKCALSLSDHPSNWLSPTIWTIGNDPTLKDITLSQLLSFTSGLKTEPAAMDSGSTGFFVVVNLIGQSNAGNGRIPGAGFYYGSAHLQVAGAMAIKARGKTSWQELFREFQAETGLFPNGDYDLPSTNNPRLAGGMHWTGEEYFAFLKALQGGQLLSPAMMAELLQDRTGAGVTIEYSPAKLQINEDWHYGFGFWQEVRPPDTIPIPGDRISSAGSYGAYPYWDRSKDLIGFLARQGSNASGFIGVNIERAVRTQIEAWATTP